jgi:hypothetical protein
MIRVMRRASRPMRWAEIERRLHDVQSSYRCISMMADAGSIMFALR